MPYWVTTARIGSSMSLDEQVKHSGFLEKSPPGVSHPDASVFITKWERRYFELIYLREPDHHVLRYYEDEQRNKVKRSIELSPAAGVKLFCNIPSQEHKNVFCLVEEKRSRKFFCAADSEQSAQRWVVELRKACPHLDPSVVAPPTDPAAPVPPTDPAAPVIGAPPTYDTLTRLVDDSGQKDKSLSARSNVTESASSTVIEADSPLKLMYEKRGVDAFGPSRDGGLMSGSSLGQADIDTLLWDEVPKAPRAESGNQLADARAKADAKSAEAPTHGALEESAYMVMTKTPTS